MQEPCTDSEKRMLWTRCTRNMGGVAAICGMCGGASAGFCYCAYRRWTPSQADLNDLRHKQTDPVTDAEKAVLWVRAQYNQDDMTPCSKPECANMPRVSCSCAYLAFTPSADEVFGLRWGY